MADSFLDQRLGELAAGERSVPLDYEELREQARENLPPRHFGYVDGGAGTGDTMRGNREAFRRYRIVGRVLRDVSDRDLRIELFGREATAPVIIAPAGRQGRFDSEGELATARAASELGVGMAVSSAASQPIEDIAAAHTDGPCLFQLYWPQDWEVAASLIGRAEAAGYDGVVLTVDSQLPKWRRRVLDYADETGRDIAYGSFESDPIVRDRAEAAGMTIHDYICDAPALDKDTSLTWDDLDTLRDWTDLPVILKGILAPDDAQRAVEWGAEGIVVSNHGGRQIDGEVAAIDQLPRIVEVVDDDMDVIFDSGIRSGADVFKALALGADAVLLGRPYLYGLAVAGERGVYEVALNCLAELESIMGLAGRASIDEIGRDSIVTTQGVGAATSDVRAEHDGIRAGGRRPSV